MKHYANCAAIHRDYSGGIARAGVTYNAVRSGGRTVHRPLTGSVKFSTALYNANSASDRDKDGIACEKS
ncbi:excalibur calcium-binding domain-containing protein [uncultured Amnibacterium sp.]|uniref:excalibur calcium-binding domain-containing protein n=1 Tax=uncultured Amnibacterium sp. TaxID=1631851 RepID=UPI0035CC2759